MNPDQRKKNNLAQRRFREKEKRRIYALPPEERDAVLAEGRAKERVRGKEWRLKRKEKISKLPLEERRAIKAARSLVDRRKNEKKKERIDNSSAKERNIYREAVNAKNRRKYRRSMIRRFELLKSGKYERKRSKRVPPWFKENRTGIVYIIFLSSRMKRKPTVEEFEKRIVYVGCTLNKDTRPLTHLKEIAANRGVHPERKRRGIKQHWRRNRLFSVLTMDDEAAADFRIHEGVLIAYLMPLRILLNTVYATLGFLYETEEDEREAGKIYLEKLYHERSHMLIGLPKYARSDLRKKMSTVDRVEMDAFIIGGEALKNVEKISIAVDDSLTSFDSNSLIKVHDIFLNKMPKIMRFGASLPCYRSSNFVGSYDLAQYASSSDLPFIIEEVIPCEREESTNIDELNCPGGGCLEEYGVEYILREDNDEFDDFGSINTKTRILEDRKECYDDDDEEKMAIEEVEEVQETSAEKENGEVIEKEMDMINIVKKREEPCESDCSSSVGECSCREKEEGECSGSENEDNVRREEEKERKKEREKEKESRSSKDHDKDRKRSRSRDCGDRSERQRGRERDRDRRDREWKRERSRGDRKNSRSTVKRDKAISPIIRANEIQKSKTSNLDDFKEELKRQMPECLYHTAFSVAEQRAKMGLGGITSNSRDRNDDRGNGGGGRDRSRRNRSGSPNEGGEQKKKSKRNYLSIKDRDRFLDMLRGLVPEKDIVGNAMVWCLDHATWAKEIAECLYESLTADETPLHKKVARFYLIADILANEAVRGVKDVFYYRQHFKALFPKIFKALAVALRQIEGRLKAEQFKQRVMNCFRAWEDVTLYPTDILIQCQNIFLGLFEVDESATDDANSGDMDGAPMEDEEDDVDGIPLERGDGEERGGEREKHPLLLVIIGILSNRMMKWTEFRWTNLLLPS